jgi:hypothetical protein
MNGGWDVLDSRSALASDLQGVVMRVCGEEVV